MANLFVYIFLRFCHFLLALLIFIIIIPMLSFQKTKRTQAFERTGMDIKHRESVCMSLESQQRQIPDKGERVEEWKGKLGVGG